MRDSRDRTSAWTIVQDVGAYADYPHTSISADLLALFLSDDITRRLSTTARNHAIKVLRLVECYLQITNRTLTIESIGEPEFSTVNTGFLGALYSERFWVASPHNRFKYASTWRGLLVAFEASGLKLTVPERIPLEASPTLLAAARKFEREKLNFDAVWLWRGWRTENVAGDTRWLKLYGLAVTHGRRVTEKYYSIADTYFSALLKTEWVTAFSGHAS